MNLDNMMRFAIGLLRFDMYALIVCSLIWLLLGDLDGFVRDQVFAASCFIITQWASER